MPSIFNIGLSGLNAANAALATVSHNIANANTPGYTRQTVQQSTYLPQGEGSVFFGNGVSVDSVTREYNKYLTDQLFSAQSDSSYYGSQLGQLSQVDNMMASTTSGLSPSLQNFFTSLQTMSQDPSSAAARQNVISSTQALVSQFQAMNDQLTQIQNGVNGQITSTVTQINALASNIATLNRQIASMSVPGSVNQPNDLLDQREQAIADLNKLVRTTYDVQPDGSYSVYIGTGQSLVQGTTTQVLSTQQNATNPANVDIVQTNFNGTSTVMPNNLLSGGQLGGFLSFRDGALLQTQVALGNMAIDFATSMNYQQVLGLTQNNVAGSNMFSDLTTYASQPQNAVAHLRMLISDPRNIAAASNMQASVVAGSTSNLVVNSVSATLPGNYGWTSPTNPPLASNHPSIGLGNIAISAISASNITATISGGPGAGVYNVVVDPSRQNGYKLVTTATPAVDVGIAFSLSGQMVGGESFSITPSTLAASGDNSNLLQMMGLQTKQLVDNLRNGTTAGLKTFQGAYASAASVVGNATSYAKSTGKAADGTLQQVTVARSNFSGVNLDQEAADLIRYQQAYQASSKVISTAQTLFQQILQLN